MISVDLHPIFRNNQDIELALRRTLFRALHTGEDMVEFIPGKGAGQLKQRVLTFLAQKHIRRLYAEVEQVPGNSGRVRVRMKPQSVKAPGRPGRLPAEPDVWEEDHDFGL
ncbi:Smr/MutS family protein [Streptomyces sp. YS415]|uniref:Smr/MutS family protein n=1 Tax=Streptomyces sp. YS415 TaxID=2944806 RepID=UPI0020212356|nr:Smr/MutS family protein [Streptomyces sp. YS415]MCL7430180.1 Smr/MutS family protein [Streptomyces sp. YS415]